MNITIGTEPGNRTPLEELAELRKAIIFIDALIEVGFDIEAIGGSLNVEMGPTTRPVHQPMAHPTTVPLTGAFAEVNRP